MRIRTVTAHAFGPLTDQTLDLADGMTVITGCNESGKTSWHAAIYAAVCGRRRGAGRPRQDKQAFIDAHQPWDHPDRWLVTAELMLDDGRRIEMRQDLAGKVDCHARDLDISADLSAEVMNEGSPDGAIWLGLDRTSFVATACVQQAQMLAVRAAAEGLQAQLQRAAATAGADSTAAAALKLIDGFYRDHVGLDRANSSKPLRRARQALTAAQQRLVNARAAHEEYLQLAARADNLARAAQAATAAVSAHEAAVAAYRAEQLGALSQRAAELHRITGGQPPARASVDDELAREAAAALGVWNASPAGRTSSKRIGSHALLSAAAAAAAAGLILLVFGRRVAGAIVLAAGLATAAAYLLVSRRSDDQARHPDADGQGRRDIAAQQLTAAAARCGITPGTLPEIARGLEKWLETRSGRLRQQEAAQNDWAELKALLAGRTLADLQQEAGHALDGARRLAASVEAAQLEAIDPATAAKRLDELRTLARQAAWAEGENAGDLGRYVRTVPSVAEAEEALQFAEDESRRVGELQETLTLTRDFLQAAQVRVHRDIAPALAATVRKHLPALTNGRYTDVTVNPNTLEVQVCGPSRIWRSAHLLSHGTAEQIYLLLRIALADHLTQGHDTCPLILDEITVHSDPRRTHEILRLLLAVAQDRQVILFTQEEQVTAWAQRHLTGAGHAVRALPTLSAC